MSKTLFENIITREIPATIVYEDDLVFAIRDINPSPEACLAHSEKRHSPPGRCRGGRPAAARALLLKAAEIAGQLGLNEGGYRLVINNGEDGGESVPHLHVHILGGRRMAWPPG